jgi:hypothetical protein
MVYLLKPASRGAGEVACLRRNGYAQAGGVYRRGFGWARGSPEGIDGVPAVLFMAADHPTS